MNVETFADTSLGPVLLNTSLREVRTPVSAGGRTTFRLLFGLRIRTGGIANGIRFNAAASQLLVTFSPLDFDTRGGVSQPQAVVSGGGQPITVSLPVPLQVRRLKFTGVGTGAGLELYRMDGDEVASESTKQPGNNQDVDGDFTDARFAVTVPSRPEVPGTDLIDVKVKGFPTGARVGIANLPGTVELTPSFFHVIPGVVGKDGSSPSGSENLGAKLAETLQQHVDGLALPYPENVDLLLVVESDAPCAFQVSQFAIQFGLLRNSFRAVLLRGADLTDAGAFATRLREASTPLTAFLRAQLSTATANAIDRAGRSVPDAVVGKLVQELNVALQTQAFYTAPRFVGITLKPETLAAATAAPTGIARTRVNRALLDEAFPREIAPIPPPEGQEKEVLRAQGATARLDLKVDLPRAITVRAATLTMEGDLRADVPSSAASSDGSGSSSAWNAPIPGATGFSLDPSRSVACKLTPQAPVEASGVSTALSITTPAAEIVAELREDQNGAPARIVGSASVKVEQLDQPAWVLFAFGSKNAVLSAGVDYWLVLRVTNGAALWLAEQAAGTTRIGDPTAKIWVDRGSFNDFAPLLQIWSSAKTTGSATNGGSANAETAERLRVRIGSAVLTPAANAGKTKVVNITAALQAFLSAQTSTGALVAAPVLVSALGKGNITVYPPDIEYDI